MGKVVLYLSLAGAAIFLVWEMFFKKKDKPVGDVLSAASDLSVSEISAKAEKIRQSMKKPKRWLWITAVLSFITAGGGAVWYFLFRGNSQQPQGLYQLGFLGMPAPAGMETDRRYLAGVMKKQREDRFHDLATQSVTKTLAGLPIRGLTANFGKTYDKDAGFQSREYTNKFNKGY